MENPHVSCFAPKSLYFVLLAVVAHQLFVWTTTMRVWTLRGGIKLDVCHTYAGCQVRTGAITERGRPDQNTNARKLSKRMGSGGTVQSNMKTGELATRSTAQMGKLKDARHQGAQGRSGCNVQLTHKRAARKKPTPQILKVESGGHVRVHAGRMKKTHPNTYMYVSISHTALSNERSRRRTAVRIAPKR